MKIKKIICKICNREISANAFHAHLKIHNSIIKEYYDKFLKSKNEDVCDYCGGGEVKFISITMGYRKYCNVKCAAISSTEKKRETKLERYGDPNYNNSNKTKQTKLERYGDEFFLNHERGKLTKEKRYGNANYNNKDKNKQTVKKRYGVDNVFQIDFVKSKSAETKKKKYGDPNYNNSNKTKQTKLERYGDVNYNNREQSEQTCLENWGVKNPQLNKNVQLKTCNMKKDRYNDPYFNNRGLYRKNCLENYNVTGMSSLKNVSNKISITWNNKSKQEKDEIVLKNKVSKTENHGDPNYINIDQINKTNQKLYGVDFPLQSPIILEKTMNGGYRWKDYILPSGRIVKIQGYENYALDMLLDFYNEKEIVYNKLEIPKIPYVGLDFKNHTYYPDFYIPKDNLIIEVKSDWTLNVSIITNFLKEESTIKNGYNFKFMVFDKHKELININKDKDIESTSLDFTWGEI